MIPISDTQRAVLVKMRGEGSTIVWEDKRDDPDNSLYLVDLNMSQDNSDWHSIGKDLFDSLLKGGFIREVRKYSVMDFDEYTITPLGLTAIGKDK